MKLLLIILLAATSSFAHTKEKIVTLSSDNTISFNAEFTSDYVATKQVEAMFKCAAKPGSDINIVLYTPGGSIYAGQLFFDTLNALPCNFNTITIFSASMGYMTVQNLGKRYIIPSGILMSHRGHVSGLSGEIGGELDSMVSLIKRNSTQLEETAANRVGVTLTKYRNLIRDELWLTASGAVKQNHADEVVLARCDASLSGRYTTRYNTFFGSFNVEFSQCPLVVGILGVKGASFEQETKLRAYYQNMRNYVKQVYKARN